MLCTPVFLGFPYGLAGKKKKIHLQCGIPGFDPWAVKIPWRKEWLPTPVFWPGESNGLVHGISRSQTLLRDFHTSLHLGHNSGFSHRD